MYPISAPNFVILEGSQTVHQMRRMRRRSVAPVLSVALGLLRPMAFSLTPSPLVPQAASEADYDCWEKARLDPDIDPQAGENMAVFVQK